METVFLPVTLADYSAWSNWPGADGADITRFQLQHSLIGLHNQPPILQQAAGRALVIGLIDPYRFSQECLSRALQGLNPSDVVSSYGTMEECIAADRLDFDLIIYYSHENGTPEATTLSNLAAIRRAYSAVPLVVLSDAEETLQAEAGRKLIESGASSFIATRTNSIFLTVGAIRFVKQGGTFEAPEKSLRDPRTSGASPARPPHLTSREMAVLRLLQRGKANKIIAHELSLSENTVKIHVRNVMRKMDATNRTQAVDKARKLWGAATGAPERPAWCRRKANDRRTDRRHGGDDDDEPE